MTRFEKWFETDLSVLPNIINLKGVEFRADSGANLIGVNVKKDGADYTLSGTVTGYIILPDGLTITVTGTIDGNKAYIILPDDAYTIPGGIRATIKLTDGNEVTTLVSCDGIVVRG